MQSFRFTPNLRQFCKMAETIPQNATQSWFDQARFIPPDAIFALTAQYVADKSPRKVNLGQGTYRDENGNPWILPSVRKSRELLSQELNHEYLPIVGLPDFRREAAKLALGPELFAKQQNKVLPAPLITTQ
jgi:aspartate aminotransferase